MTATKSSHTRVLSSACCRKPLTTSTSMENGLAHAWLTKYMGSPTSAAGMMDVMSTRRQRVEEVTLVTHELTILGNGGRREGLGGLGG